MIEKRTMWMVEPCLKMHQVNALYDLEKNEVIAEHYSGEDYEEDDDDWYQVHKGERFFNTESEAREYRTKLIDETREKMKTCKELIEELDNIEEDDDFKFEPKDYLGYYANTSSRHDYYYQQYRKYEKISSLLATIARSRHFNVNARTILIDEVVSVHWYKNKAILVMRGGDTITTNNDEEMAVVETMFGSNRSGMSF